MSHSMISSMRGLNTFISEIRACRSREQEEKRINKELANVRAKFKEANLNGYSKKKYVSKLLYIYLLGYDVDFGHVDAVNLITSTKYTEKQIGYVAVTLLLTETSDLIRLVVNSIKKDLDDVKEVNNCLALQAIANLGGREIAEAVAPSVFKILCSSQHVGFPRKKAALCLLRLYRKHADVIPVADWADQIVACLDEYDFGLNLSALHLVTALAQQYPDKFAVAVPKVIQRLYKIVIDKEYTPDNVYYTVPVPWLQVAIFRFLQLYPAPTGALRDKLNEIIQASLNLVLITSKNVQQNNASNAVLLDAISLAVHLDPESDYVIQGANILGRYLTARETNMRYLGLETMVNLAAYPNCLDIIKTHQDIILASLKDKDVSVRRRALDLIYCMCDASNSRAIVDELVQYLAIADHSMKEEMVLKIALLSEKFAVQPDWYMDVILQLLTIAGDQVSNEVWYRVIQIVTNTPSLHEYAAKRVLGLLKLPTCHETVVKVAAYVLGEFGDFISSKEGCSPADQFLALKGKYLLCGASTRAIILSTYIKFVNLFPEIKREIVIVFQQHLSVIDSDLQQRASEYLAMAQMPNDDLLQTVFEQMPPFPERESALVQRLRKQILESGDKRALALVQRERQKRNNNVNNPTAAPPEGVVLVGNTNATVDLLGLDAAMPAVTKSEVGSAKIEAWYNDLLKKQRGVLFEDSRVQLGVKTEYVGNTGHFSIFIGNKCPAALSNFQMSIQQVESLRVAQTNPQTNIPAGAQTEQVLEVSLLTVPTQSPTLNISFNCAEGYISLPTLKLPIGIHKFIEPIVMASADFLTRWRQIGGPPKEVQEVLKSTTAISISDMKAEFGGSNFGVLEGIDPNPNNIVLAAIVNVGASGKVGCLVRVECNLDQKMYRVTVRATQDLVAAAVRDHLKEKIAKI